MDTFARQTLTTIRGARIRCGPIRSRPVEQPLIVDVIKLTLEHGVYVTREAQDVAEATAAERMAPAAGCAAVNTTAPLAATA